MQKLFCPNYYSPLTIHHSSFIIHNYAFYILHSSFYIHNFLLNVIITILGLAPKRNGKVPPMPCEM